MAEDDIHEGGCVCGAVRFKTKGPPRHAFACHCAFCQRASGSAFSVEAIFPKEAVEITGGPLTTYEHRSDESGRALFPRFCARCGTRVAMAFEWVPDLLIVFGGTFDDPDWFEVDRHIFTRSAVRWMAYPPGVKLHEKHWLDR